MKHKYLRETKEKAIHATGDGKVRAREICDHLENEKWVKERRLVGRATRSM